MLHIECANESPTSENPMTIKVAIETQLIRWYNRIARLINTAFLITTDRHVHLASFRLISRYDGDANDSSSSSHIRRKDSNTKSKISDQ